MCGIIGVAGYLNLRDENTIRRLLVLDTLRGQDSTGLAAVRNNGKDVVVAKVASHPFNLFDTKSFSDALNNNNSKAFIGHNRSATSGKKDAEVNAHPFQFGHITGVHNGTLADGDQTLLEKKLGEKFNVDSQALFAAIAQFGVKEVIPLLTKGKDHYRGAWSLVWWDAQTDKLNFLRNDHRPMWYCFTEDCKQIWWASEWWMLDAALNHTQIGTYKFYMHQSKENPEKKYKFRQIPIDMWLTLDVNKIVKGGKEPTKFYAVPLAGKEPVAASNVAPFVMGSGPQHGSGCGGSSTNLMHDRLQQLRQKSTEKAKTSTGQTKKFTHSTGTQPSEPGLIHLIGDTDQPYARYVEPFEFGHFGHEQRGGDPLCNWCREPVTYGAPGITVFFRDNVLICTKCSGHEEVSALSDIAPATRFIVTRAMMKEAR
jgi:hypothetical protein